MSYTQRMLLDPTEFRFYFNRGVPLNQANPPEYLKKEGLINGGFLFSAYQDEDHRVDISQGFITIPEQDTT